MIDVLLYLYVIVLKEYRYTAPSHTVISLKFKI